MEGSKIACINCGKLVDTSYCPTCGQSMKVLPISWKSLIIEFTSKWIGLDNKFIRTFSQLITQPQVVITSYFAGNRTRYIGPLTYLIVMSALYILTFEIFDISIQEFLSRSSENFRPTEMSSDEEKLMIAYFAKIADHMRLMVILMIPFMALSLRIFYRKFNYLQNLMLFSLLSAQLLWLYIVTLLIYVITGLTDTYIGMFISIAYFVYVIGRTNPQRSGAWTYAKPILAWVIGFFIFVIAISILTIIVVPES